MKKNHIQYLKNGILILFAFGVVLGGYGAYQYYVSDQRIDEIEAERRETEETLRSIDPEFLSGINPTPIAGQDIQRRRELNEKYAQRDDATKIVGVGIALVAFSWIMRDIVMARLKNQQPEIQTKA